ncbi:MAG: CRTAC1 family protein [Bdellovibrionaceae bacterium]|nr:CRTAC1 family protein [Pseudobdellovibrionaceae bacterium]
MKFFSFCLRSAFYLILAGVVSAPFWKGKLRSHTAKQASIILREVGTSAGVDFHHRNDLTELFRNQPQFAHLNNWLEAISASVAIVDLNKDGLYDIFFTSTEMGSASGLFINQGDGTFKERSKDYNLTYLLTAARPLFFDCDNDGELEVFVTAHMKNLVYKMDKDGKYQKYFTFPDNVKPQISVAANILDFNNDGNLDVVFGGMGHLNAPESMVSAENGSPLQLFEGNGTCDFKDASEKMGFKGNVFVHAIGVGDFWNRGGVQDLWIATDFNEDHILRHEGAAGYVDVSSLKRKGQSQNGMASEIFYENDSKYPSIYVSHIYEPGYFTDGNKVWRWDEQSGTYVNVARDWGVHHCGWGWAGMNVDLSNKGFADFVVVNGFVTGESKSNWWFKIQTTTNSLRPVVGNPRFWPKMDDLNLSGRQRDCVFSNDGANHYTDIAESLDFDHDRRDGRGLARIDFNNDGLPDLVVANQKQRASLYLNESPSGNWVGFELKATKSHWQALGAQMTLHLSDGSFMKRYHNPYNGYASQHDPRHVFGLGDRRPEKLVIKWPSGVETVVTDLKTGTYNKVTDHE